MAIGDVYARIVRSDGQEMTLGSGDWRIPKDGLENWANLAYSVSSVEIPSYDGALVTSKRVAATDRTIKAVVGNSRDNEALRARAIRFFNPKHSFKVYMTYMGRTRWCSGEQIGFRASEGNIYEPVEVEWTILCPNPYLLSVNDFGKDIAEIMPSFGFPFMSFLPESTAHVNRDSPVLEAGRYSQRRRRSERDEGHDHRNGRCGESIAENRQRNRSAHNNHGQGRCYRP